MKKYIYAQYSFPAFYWKADIQAEQSWKNIQDAYKGTQQMGHYQKIYVVELKYPWKEEYTYDYIISMHPINYLPKEYVRHESYIMMDVIPTTESVAKKLGYNRKMTEEEYAEKINRIKNTATK